MTNSKPRSPLELWPALRVTLFEFFTQREARNMLAAATVSPSLFDDCESVNDVLDICDSYFTVRTTDWRTPAEEAGAMAEQNAIRGSQISHLFSEVLGKVATHRDPEKARARLETVANRLHFYIIGTTIVPVELQVPQEITTLPEVPLAALQKAINRYRDGDLDGAMTAICAAVDGACEELVGGRVENWNDLNFVQKVQKAHMPCMARLQVAAGLPEEEMTIVVAQSKRAVMAAAEVLARFRREYSDAHGLSKAPAPLVQTAFDSAVYLLRVLAPRPAA